MGLDGLLAPKILVVAGKGGVGRSTVAAALAIVAARRGRKVCIAEVDRKGTLPRLFGRAPSRYEPSELRPGIWGLTILPEQALEEYLEVQYHMKRMSKLFKSTHFVDYITTAAPGLEDILVLGKIWYLEQDRSSGRRDSFDTIIVDAPAAGHMLSFLSAPMGLSDAVQVGPIKRQADWLVEMLRDSDRTQVHLVTLAEDMPVAETLETARALATRVGVSQGVTFANAIYPNIFSRSERTVFRELAEGRERLDLLTEAEAAGIELDPARLDSLVDYGRWLEARRAIQARHLRRLRKESAGKVVELPFVFSAALDLGDVERLANAIEERAG
jgi:anion-transporting  ArsA/GET3 family ATPase